MHSKTLYAGLFAAVCSAAPLRDPAFERLTPVLPRDSNHARDADPAVQVDLAGTDLFVKRKADPAVQVDLAGTDLFVKRKADPAVQVDLAGTDVFVKRQVDEPGAVTENILGNLCKGIGGTQTTQNVCQTAVGTDIVVAAASPENGLVLVTLRGAGLLDGASITVPVESLESIVGKLGL